MKNRFKDKVVIITGGTRGIGRSCCLAFAKLGANIVFTYHRSKDQADKLAQEIKDLGVQSLNMQADAKDFAQCQAVVKKTLETFRKIDILVNNAGIVKDRALAMMTIDDWWDVVHTNLGGTFNMTRACIVTFLKQKEGCIVNMSSISGLVGIPRQTNYSASKAGIIGFSKALAKEVAAYNVRVNVVCPGYIKTDMVESLHAKVRDKITEEIPAKRLGTPEEVAQLCVFLASDDSDYLTGKVVEIDGGLAA